MMDAKFISDGPTYFNLLNELITLAEYEIHLQTYIFEPDTTGRCVLNNLIIAAKRGVKIYIVVDSYGSWLLNKEIKQLDLPRNFKIKFFGPPLLTNFFYAGRRLHHKVVCVDNKKVLIGGINIADKYHGTESEPAWLDFAIFAINTRLANNITKICKAIFEQTFEVNYPFFIRKKGLEHNDFIVLQNDWYRQKNQIFKYYKKELLKAKEEIIIVAAYFLPGIRLRNALKRAAKRGVKIAIILSGKSDVPLIKSAINHLYQFLFRNNISIYEWQKSILHGKLMLIDSKQLTVGSFNLNHLSQYGSIELNVATNNQEVCKAAQNKLLSIIEQSTPINSINKYHFLQRIYFRICYFIIRFAMILITLKPYFLRKRPKGFFNKFYMLARSN